MTRLPFYLGNLIADFVPGHERRKRTRGEINTFLYGPRIAVVVHKLFNEKVHSIKFIRQNTLNRVVCLVNNEYYVKIFRSVTNKQLKNLKFLIDYVRPYLSVNIPIFECDNHNQISITKRVEGRHLSSFTTEQVLENKEKIEQQLYKIIDELQSIDVDKIPNKERFMDAIQVRTKEDKCEPAKQVLAHFDLNTTNLLFDDDMNICAIIDWDELSIATNPNTDKKIFLKYWNAYLKKITKNQ